MKKFVAVFCLLLCATTIQAKDKPNPADFNIKIHISSSLITGELYLPLRVNTILNGKKVVLAGNYAPFEHGAVHVSSFNHPLIAPGDYQIRLIEDLSEKDGTSIQQEYEILLSNGNVWRCVVISISE